MQSTNSAQGRVIGNVGVLDLRRATEESIRNIAGIGNVGMAIYSPETAQFMSRINIGNVGMAVEVSTEAKFINGHLNIDTNYFTGFDEPATILINGHIIVSEDVPIEDIQAKLAGLVVNGHIIYPEHLSGAIHSKIIHINGHTLGYSPGDRLLTGRVTIDESFLHSLDDDTNLAATGRLYIPETIPNDLIERKIASIKGRGRVRLHEENEAAIVARLGDSLGMMNVTVIPGGYKLIDEPLNIDEFMLNALADRMLYCTDWVCIDADVSPDLLSEKIEALTSQGVVISPAKLKGSLSSILETTQSRTIFYEGELWLIEDETELPASRFDFLEGSATIVNMGELTFGPEIEPRVLADRLSRAHNFGEIMCTREQMGAIQARLGINEGEFIDSSTVTGDDGGNYGHLAL